MKLKDYSGINKITLEDFLSLNEEQAVRFDFLTQGEEADRTELTNSIYHKLFPWFDEKRHAGDTINTYRIAVKKYYGKYYRFLDRRTQLEIIGIVKNVHRIMMTRFLSLKKLIKRVNHIINSVIIIN